MDKWIDVWTDEQTDGRQMDKHTDGQIDGWTDGRIILILRGFKPMACGRVRSAQLWASRITFYCQFKAAFSKKIRYNL